MRNQVCVVVVSIILLFSGCLGQEATVNENANSDSTVNTNENATFFEGDEVGECSDLADNDQDGLFDCDDPNCSGSPTCQNAENPCDNTSNDTGNNTDNNVGNNDTKDTGNNSGNSTNNGTENNTGNSTNDGSQNNTGNDTGNNPDNNSSKNFSGNWMFQSSISYTCSFGIVNLNISSFEISDFNSTQSIENFSINVSNYNGEIRTMDGNYSNHNFSVQYFVEGGCDETYTLSGQFNDSVFTGRFDAQFSGTNCYDCSDDSWEITANLM